MKKAKTNKFILEAHSFSSSPRLSPFLCLALECEANTRATNNTKRVHKFSCERTHRDSSSCVFDKSFVFFFFCSALVRQENSKKFIMLWMERNMWKMSVIWRRQEQVAGASVWLEVEKLTLKRKFFGFRCNPRSSYSEAIWFRAFWVYENYFSRNSLLMILLDFSGKKRFFSH